MRALTAFVALLILIMLAHLGAGMAEWRFLFGIIIPYAAIAVFVLGFVYRVITWARTPVPFRIPTTCGQQKSHPWIKSDSLENPQGTWGVIGRMALEVLLFRSVFRNTKAEIREGPRILYGAEKWLWLGGLAFHWLFLLICIRHFRYFTEPVPVRVLGLQNLDGFFQIGLPLILLTDVIIVAALSFLFLRRICDKRLRYISLPSDYFALFLLLGITLSGIFMRYFGKTDIVSVKKLAVGLLGFQPVLPDGIGLVFFIHMFLVCVLLVYFPFSKLMHMPGIFMSPTRNLANNNRLRRHVNPWDYPVKVHTYAEYEEDFRYKMKAEG